MDTLDARSIETAATVDAADIASINGIALHASGESLDPEALRQRACIELLRQAAQRAGLLAADDPPPLQGATSEAANAGIETLLERELRIAEPSAEACRRYHAAHAAAYSVGEQVRARHVLFAVTPEVDVNALRQRAEACLLDLRCAGSDSEERFARAAADCSNCPSGAHGGELGWLRAEDCAPEFARELFGHAEIGVLPRLVHSRFGLHVVEALERRPGRQLTFEDVHAAVAQALRQQSFGTALRRYLRQLAAQAQVCGVDLS